jgi:hypothetical protein
MTEAKNVLVYRSQVAFAKGSVALGVVLLLFAAIMAAILVSRRRIG